MTTDRTNLWKAAMFVVVAPSRYKQLGIDRILSANLDGTNEAFERLYRDDAQYREVQLTTFGKQVADECASLRGRLASSMVMALVVGLVALSVAWHAGSVHVVRPIDPLKACNLSGAILAGWATLFGLGTSKPVWDGNSLQDLVAPILFRVIFVPGLLLIAAGAVI